MIKRNRPHFLRYCATASPVGTLYVAATEKGLCRLELKNGPEEGFAQGLHQSIGVTPFHDPQYFKAFEKEIALYFQGKVRKFKTPIDWSDFSPFQKRVLEELIRIPYGKTISYGEIARSIGKPTASRAVGTAIARNPVPIVLPCHRVIPAGGGLGGYIWGQEIKRKLLLIEGAHLK